MTDTRGAFPTIKARARRPAGAAAGWSAGMLLAVIGVAAFTALLSGLPAAMPLTAALAMSAVVALVLWNRSGREAGGMGGTFALCNRVTLLRAALASLLCGFLAVPAALAQPAVGWGLLAVAVAALALDGVDGWLARARGEASAFGARFDMEVDAALILVLAALSWASGKAGGWVLALGLMRYAFVAAGALWPWLTRPLPPSLRRKAVCVVQVAVLAALLAPVVQPPLSEALAALALGALAWSFAIDLRWLWRRRGRPA